MGFTFTDQLFLHSDSGTRTVERVVQVKPAGPLVLCFTKESTSVLRVSLWKESESSEACIGFLNVKDT